MFKFWNRKKCEDKVFSKEHPWSDGHHDKELNEQRDMVSTLAVTFALTGDGYDDLRTSLNRYLDACGADHGATKIYTRARRRLATREIMTLTSSQLSIFQKRELYKVLLLIADNDIPRRNSWVFRTDWIEEYFNNRYNR